MRLPEGYRVRAATRDDLDELAGLLEAADAADVGFADPARDEILESWAEPWFDLSTDSLVVLEPEDTPVGYAEALAKDASIQVFGFARIHPGHRGRGLGTYAAAWLETQAADKIAAGVTAPFRSFCPSMDRAAIALLTGRGYEHVRSFWHMERAVVAGEASGEGPSGITIRTGTAGEDQRVAWRIIESAFRDHFGFESLTFEEALAWWQGAPGYDPAWTLLAFEEETPVGVAQLLLSGGSLWVGELGVLDAWRGRGIGMALLRHSFAFAAEHGFGEVRLGVDAENTTGATRLYERAGMKVRREFRTMELLIEGATPSD